ncbi:hypothetical protein F4604DRAFT_1010463 [Suillus subluteus]|nr:hypothetical protein F4604DRAFT_1010463 [Suillus subluteus]
MLSVQLLIVILSPCSESFVPIGLRIYMLLASGHNITSQGACIAMATGAHPRGSGGRSTLTCPPLIHYLSIQLIGRDHLVSSPLLHEN